MTQNLSSIALPKRMRTRPRDKRGFPIPFIVLIDKSGTPQFTINDARRTEECRRKKLCAICGKRFEDGMWLVGGSRCFMHPHGAFIDPPVDYECGEYALRVCPFLAAPRYTKGIEDAKLDPSNIPDAMKVARVDFMPPLQPERFGFGLASDLQAIDRGKQGWLYQVHRWGYVEWWKNGARVSAPDALPEDQAVVRF